MKEYAETHQKGRVSIENKDDIERMLYYAEEKNVDFGIQIAKDGRVWVCINGIAFIRFKPEGMGFGEVLSRTIIEDESSIPPMHPRVKG